MRMILICLSAIIILTGCNSAPYRHQSGWTPSTTHDTNDRKYQLNLATCAELGRQGASNPDGSAIAGAALGAGLMGLVMLATGAEAGYLLGAGALAGGVQGYGGTANSNEARYREVLVRCMIDRGFQVY